MPNKKYWNAFNVKYMEEVLSLQQIKTKNRSRYKNRKDSSLNVIKYTSK